MDAADITLIAGSWARYYKACMVKALSVLFALSVWIAAPVSAEVEPGCAGSEAACVLEAAWAAALVLPQEKQARLKPLIVSMAAQAEGAQLMQLWADKLSVAPVGPAQQMSDYPDFGWNNASEILATSGVDGLIRFAKEKRAPLHYGRSDALLSAGKRMVAERPDAATRLNDALFDLAATASDFEKPDLANAAAELAMHRCDLVRFDRAAAMTLAPNNLRYAFWRARMTGNAGGLASRVRAEADAEDTRHVRQVLDGYRAIVELGYCP